MSLEESNAALRAAVENRLSGGCCDGGKCHAAPEDNAAAWNKFTERFTGDSLLRASDIHPTSQAFLDLLDTIRELHLSKSEDYGCPSGTDPLANIRNGAKFVGIPAFKAAMVRLSDKVTRLATFNATGRLHFEGVEDTLLDLASYSLLTLVLYREDQGK
jgi:hypothetical protein